MSSTKSGSWTLDKPPRSWQSEALAAWQKSLRGIVAVVTGGGKTTFAQMCMQVFHDRFPDGRFVVIVPTLALMDQWYVSLREDLHIQHEDIAFYSGEGLPKSFSLVNLMVVNTARTWASRIASNGPCMLIVDECHRAASDANALALSGNPTAALGLSATPEREHDDLFQRVLVPALGPIVYRYDYNRALEDQVIVPFDLANVSITMTDEEQRRYDIATKDVARTLRHFEANGTSLDNLKTKMRLRARIATESIQRIPAVIRLAEQERGGRIIVFHETIRAAETILSILQARTFNATIYHSRLNPVLRRDNLRLYRMGAFDTLVTCRALDEGINIPETNVAIIASSTASSRQRIQRMGRVLRPAPGKSRAKIYTIYATKPEQERLIKEALSLTGAGTITWMHSSFEQHDAAASKR